MWCFTLTIPSTWSKGKRVAAGMKPAWSPQGVPGQPKLQSETLPETNRKITP